MSLLYLVGSGYNQIARAVAAPVAGSALSGFSVSALYNGRADQAFIFDGEPLTLDFDLNQVTNPGFETAFASGLPAAATAIATWGKSSGATLTRDTSTFMSGVASMRVDGADEYAYFDQVVSAGEYLVATAAARSPTLSVPFARIACQNLNTGNWLTSSLGWSSALTYWYSGGTSWDAAPAGAFQVESFSACRTDRPTLRWRFVCASPGTEAWFDDFYVWPRVNFAFAHNHNFPPSVGVGMRSSASGFSSTTLRGAFTTTPATMYVVMANVDERYWRLISTAPPDDRDLFMWQFVLGQYQTASRVHLEGHTIGTIDVQDRSSSEIGQMQAYIRGAHARRQVELQFKHPSVADAIEHAEIQKRSRNGAHPLVVVLDSADPSSALLCRSPDVWKLAHVTTTLRQSSLVLDEFPFGIVTP